MGVYRLFLAALVAVSHAGIRFYSYNPGVIAVVSFYILSGYVMSMLIEKYYKQPSTITTFYLDRAARLFPQFIFYMLITSVLIYFFKVDFPFTSKLTFSKWLLNLFILPQGFFMFWADQALVIPQAWSLGLEITFYLVIPWILVCCSKNQIYGFAAFSFLVFLIAYLGKIDSDTFGYRLLPGTLFMFLIGWSIFTDDTSSRVFRFIAFLSIFSLLFIAYMNKELYQLPYNKEVLVGLLIGIAVISYIKHLGFSNRDEFFGNLSYGVFLNHFFIISIMQKFFEVKTFGVINLIILLLVSNMLALASFFYIERPALKWRHTIRNKSKVAPI
ncbi:MAG: acyltransferase, partial [Methylococcales bacterium]